MEFKIVKFRDNYPSDNNINVKYSVSESPRFISPIVNVTVPVGREAVLECMVDNLSTFRVCITHIISIYVNDIVSNYK